MSASHDRSPAPDTTDIRDSDHVRHLALLQAAIADPAAFEPLYQQYVTDVYYFCYRRTGHPEEAADATSQVFVKVLRALPRYRVDPTNAGAAFRAWLFRIAGTTVIDQQRWHRPADSLDAVDSGAPAVDLASPDRSPDEHVIDSEDAQCVRAMLRWLPDRQRRVVELRLADLSGQEIADTLGISLSAVKSAQFRAYRTLRRVLTASTCDVDMRSKP